MFPKPVRPPLFVCVAAVFGLLVPLGLYPPPPPPEPPAVPVTLFPEPVPPPKAVALLNTEFEPLLATTFSEVVPAPPAPIVTVYAVPGCSCILPCNSPPAPEPPEAPEAYRAAPPPATTKTSVEYGAATVCHPVALKYSM